MALRRQVRNDDFGRSGRLAASAIRETHDLVSRRDIGVLRVARGWKTMPYGRSRFSAKTSGLDNPPPAASAAKTRTRPLPLSATKMSPLGAVRITRGCLRPVENTCTAKPFGTSGSLPCGAGTTFASRLKSGSSGSLSTCVGRGRSVGLMCRLTPGASLSQVPKAAAPVRTSWACRGASQAIANGRLTSTDDARMIRSSEMPTAMAEQNS